MQPMMRTHHPGNSRNESLPGFCAASLRAMNELGFVRLAIGSDLFDKTCFSMLARFINAIFERFTHFKMDAILFRR